LDGFYGNRNYTFGPGNAYEVQRLRQRHIFGQWSAEEDVKNIDLSKAGKEFISKCPDFQELHDRTGI
jgi:hypothetical protein